MTKLYALSHRNCTVIRDGIKFTKRTICNDLVIRHSEDHALYFIEDAWRVHQTTASAAVRAVAWDAYRVAGSAVTTEYNGAASQLLAVVTGDRYVSALAKVRMAYTHKVETKRGHIARPLPGFGF